MRIDLESGEIDGRASVAANLTSLAVGEDAVWALSRRTSRSKAMLARIDTETVKVVGELALAGDAQEIAAGEGRVWVSQREPAGVRPIQL